MVMGRALVWLESQSVCVDPRVKARETRKCETQGCSGTQLGVINGQTGLQVMGSGTGDLRRSRTISLRIILLTS